MKMSASDVLVNCENVKPKITEKKAEDKIAVDVCNEDEAPAKKEGEKPAKEEMLEEKPMKSESIMVYNKEELLELRSAPVSLKKPDCLSEEFFNKDGVWDPESWHKSSTSRSASPSVGLDGKTVLVEGKKLDLVDDDIELAPRRRSFRQGCHVQTLEGDKTEKATHRVVFDRKNRLTGRAASQRRSAESSYDEKSHEFDKLRREKYTEDKSSRYARFADKENRYQDRDNDRFFDRDRSADQKGEYRNEKFKATKNEKTFGNSSKKKTHGEKEEKLPEWMIDGPTSQLDIMEFTGFQDIEEGRKAYAKHKKKVRISPAVDIQESINKVDSIERKKVLNDEKANKEEKSGKSIPEKNFDLNDFFNEVDYYPPHLFHEDLVKGDGIKSRFTQWFSAKQSQSSSSNSHGSRPGSAPLVPDEVFAGMKPKSPVTSTPYFTPIQPAPAFVTAAASAHAVQTSNIQSIMQQQNKTKVENKKSNKEIKGRMTVEDLEEKSTDVDPEDDASKSAFDMLIMSMKEAGQLPEKPAPVVTGLPDHLLPQPPKRTSPSFEKLKRILSRSPSPVQMMNAISTVASIISSNPSIDHHLSHVSQGRHLTSLPESTFFDTKSDIDSTSNRNNAALLSDVSENSFMSGSNDSSTNQLKRLPTAFTPTSVLKKIHNEKQRESPIPYQQPDVSFIDPSTKKTYPDLLNESLLRSSQQSSTFSNSERSQLKEPVPVTPDRSNGVFSHSDNMLPFHSAPTTPRQRLNLPVGSPVYNQSHSVPSTPDNRYQNNPPSIYRVKQPPGLSPTNASSQNGSAFTLTKPTLLAPSAFTAATHDKGKNDVGVIGSGIPQKCQNDYNSHVSYNQSSRGFADPRLAPGNGATRSSRSYNSSPNDPSLAPGNPLRPLIQSTPMPPQQHMQQSQQQQLLQAQRMAQIQQAQLLQQQKLQQIAQQANQQKLMQQQKHQALQSKMTPGLSGVRPLLPDPESSGQSRATTDQIMSQQQQQQQIHSYQQQQLQAHQQARPQAQFLNGNFRGRPFPPPHVSRNSPPIPMPMQQPHVPGLHNMNQPRGMQNLAAQALVQQHLLTNAARARFIAQAQLLQQPQVVQAAIMAQAALARGQAQAHAAMMLNPRNLQAMAEQMGIKLPMNKAIPTPMMPPPAQPNLSGNVSNDTLSQWFSPDVLQHLPHNKTSTDAPSVKILSVEELEKTQRSS